MEMLYTLLTFAGLFVMAESNRNPQFRTEMDVVNVKEEQPAGTFITREIATDYERDKIKYRIEGDTHGFFVINSDNGEVKTTKKIDKEALDVDTLKISLIAYEVENPKKQGKLELNVVIRNINDNLPIFDKDSINRTIVVSENEPHGQTITELRATDADNKKGSNDDLFYYITKGNELKHFKIGRINGRLTLNKQLDYETQTEFKLTIAVKDGRPNEQGVHVTTTELLIKVKDEDDMGAKFDSNYTVTINEGTYERYILKKVHAQDQDKAIDASIIYNIEPTSNLDGLFSINKDGDVFVNGKIDREQTASYTLLLRAVEASERNSFPKHSPAKATLTVIVADINDNKPEFVQREFVGYVLEHAAIHTVVMTTKAVDIDTGDYAKFTYRLRGEDSSSFIIDKEGTISVAKDIDRETKVMYAFKVEAVEAVEEGKYRNSQATVTIIVRDKNDHTPIFKKTSYEASISENSPINNTITSVSASDPDSKENGQVVYSIIKDTDGNCFHIDSHNGRITLLCPLDREEKDQYSFLVKAADQNKDGNERSSHAQVKVKVLDENDNMPVFSTSRFYKSINYDDEIGSTIMKLTATDKDLGEFGKVSYRIMKGNSHGKFRLKKDTGVLLIANPLANLFGEFTIVVEAFDNNDKRPSLTSKKNAEVIIKVEKKGFNSVIMIMKVETGHVLDQSHKIEGELEDILDIGILTDEIRVGDARTATHYIFHGYNKDTGVVIRSDEVIEKLKQVSLAMTDFSNKWNVSYFKKLAGPEPPNKNVKQIASPPPTWTPIIYAVLGFSALIVLFGIIGIVYLIRSRRRYDDGGASQTSSRVPINARNRSRSYWNDPGFESVSQINSESYVHSSGFLSQSYEKYDLDPSNMYNNQDMYHDDPFSVIIERPRSNSARGSDDASSHASSGFAASSVMTVCRAPTTNGHGGGGGRNNNCDSKPLLNGYRHSHKRMSGPSPRERRLSVIVDDEGNQKQLLDTIDNMQHRPPSYEYDFDEKIPDDY